MIKHCKTCANATWTRNKSGARITTTSKKRPAPGMCTLNGVYAGLVHGNSGTDCKHWIEAEKPRRK